MALRAPAGAQTDNDLESVLVRLRACRICRDTPRNGPPLPHEPRPIIQADAQARILIASQAPGNRAHVRGLPFYDPSGIRLREWLGLDEAQFYDPKRLAIVPMGHCFPGYDGKGGDLPPRRECAPAWREAVLGRLPRLSLILTIGIHAQRYHLGAAMRRSLTETVRDWRSLYDRPGIPRILPLPHPSWRNNAWLRKNPWFADELLPILRKDVAALMAEAERDAAQEEEGR
ncbi:MAG: uracil-DNA glycosylase family protein [Salinarimonas sp.]|nr:uracil-DNA glycosylase family protein [Salinarimonas sp.]